VAFKLVESGQARWRAVYAPHLVAPVRAAPSSRRANSSSATNQEVISKSHDTTWSGRQKQGAAGPDRGARSRTRDILMTKIGPSPGTTATASVLSVK
jgi:hypothetical protein